MTRIVAIIAALLLAMPVSAMAEGILTPGWEQQPVGALQDARDAIDRRITELQHSAAAEDALTFTGHGQGIISGFTLPEGAYGYLISLAEPVTGSMVICEDGKAYTARQWSACASYAHAAHYKKSMAIDYITMDFESDWTLTVMPLPDAPSAAASGTGSGVSGFFLPASAQQVEITVTASCSGYYCVSVLEANFYRTCIGGSGASYDTLSAGETRTDTYLLTPDKQVYGYIWFVNCPEGFSWSIRVM